MTIPATPAKTETVPDTLPVRHVLVCNKATSRGDYPTGYAWSGCKDRWYTDTDTMYTLLPPHLADEWRRLREAKADAEDAMYDGALASPPSQLTTKEAWTQFWNAQKALATFEATHGIGGGA